MRCLNIASRCFAILVSSTGIASAEQTEASAPEALAYTTIYSFPYSEGPDATYDGIIDLNNNRIYGTTIFGGRNGYGDIYELTPPEQAHGEWTYKSLHSFRPPRFGPKIKFHKSVLYGTLHEGAKNDGACSELFALAKVASDPDKWVFKVLKTFSRSEGCRTLVGVEVSKEGVVYGVTGTYNGFSPRTPNVVWRYDTRTDDSPFKVLHRLTKAEGTIPSVPVLYKGSLFATAEQDGPFFIFGSAFKTDAITGATTTFESFNAANSGRNPDTGLARLKGDAWVGSTHAGGKFLIGNVFVLRPPSTTQGHWTHEIVHSFTAKDGLGSAGTPLTDSQGSIYLAVSEGDARPCGSVLKFTKKPGPGWETTLLHVFNRKEGCLPTGNLVSGPNGALYGTTREGGREDGGVVYKITGSGFVYPPL